MRIATCLLPMLLLPSLASAGWVTQGGLEVDKVFAGYTGPSGGEIYFRVDATPLNPFSCSLTTSSSRVLIAGPDYNNVDRVLSVLLAAQMAGKKIEVQIYDDKCFKNRALIRRVAVY